MSFSIYLAKAVLDHVFGKAAYSAPTLYIGLSSANPTEAGNAAVEPAGGSGYARQSAPASSWASATSADPAVITNTVAITFPIASATYLSGVNLTHFVLFDAITGGNVLASGALDVAKPILQDDTAYFPIGTLTFTLD
jgi:hypothetical protein